jgi:hypothetical protein
MLCLWKLPLVTTCIAALSTAVGAQSLTGENARDIARVTAPPLEQLNNLRNVVTVEAVRKLVPGIVANPQSPSGQLLIWHALSLNLLAVDHVSETDATGHQIHFQQYGPHRSSYALAMIHLAMYETANAYSKSPHHYTSWVEGYLPGAVGSPPTNSSEAAAIVESAYRVIVHLYPTFAAELTKERNAAITAIAAGATNDVKAGQAFGDKIAALVIGIRANDNSALPEPRWGVDFVPKSPPGTPGQWQVDPVSQIMTALGANWGKVTPFILTAADEFKLPGPPPANLHDAKYKKAFDEVKTHGGDDRHNIKRAGPDDEKFYAIFWSYDGSPGLCAPSRLYNQIADQVLMDHMMELAPDAASELSPEGAAEIARYYALVNTAMADAGIAAWHAKYQYQYWRPVSGIRAEQATHIPPDGDDLLDVKFHREEVWYPLGAQTTNAQAGFNITPPFPAYPSGHAVFGSALFEVLRELVPNDKGFSFQSDEFNGKTALGPNIDAYNFIRCKDGEKYSATFCGVTKFDTFDAAETSNSLSRVWMGVHWAFDATDGEGLGKRIGTAVVSRSFKRTP